MSAAGVKVASSSGVKVAGGRCGNDDFVVKNGARHLDYDKVRRYAFSMQIDDEICAVLGAEACAESVAWGPDDDWITQTCLAFRETKVQMEAAAGFGGVRQAAD